VNSLSSTSASHSLFRSTVLVFAFVLACQAIWILTAEFARPSRLDLSGKSQSAAIAYRNAASLAASLGLVRGDLWAECALTYFDLNARNRRDSMTTHQPKTIEQAAAVAERALALAPHDARIWLVVADADSRLTSGHNADAALRMSYYTGANETGLIPLRLLLAVNSEGLIEKDLQQLVRHDILTIITRKPELKPAILAAYRDAPPLGRKFLEDTLRQIDPTMLEKLHI
jgi:hypothetical protein